MLFKERFKKKKLDYNLIQKDDFEGIVDEVDGFHHCRICDKTFNVMAYIPFGPKYAMHQNSKAHKEAKEKLLTLLGGSG